MCFCKIRLTYKPNNLGMGQTKLSVPNSLEYVISNIYIVIIYSMYSVVLIQLIELSCENSLGEKKESSLKQDSPERSKFFPLILYRFS